MQFSVLALFSLVALVAAGPTEMKQVVRRQTTDGSVPVEAAAMTDASGNVVAFDSTKVYKDNTAKGL